ncbi:MAG: DUF3237 domain-containing protein [Thermodesulfobacteriota bacterium]
MENHSDVPVASMPALRLLYSSQIEVGPALVIGNTPAGFRRVIPILGGRFSGPRIRGRVLPGGADWQIVRLDGTLEVEARYTLETEQGQLIYVTNRGLRHGPPEIIERLSAGMEVSPDLYYFRTTPILEAGDPSLAWLNAIVAVASGERHPAHVVITVYEVM